MNYLLTILTNGRRECFERAVYAFVQHASPLPDDVMVMDDGGQTGADFATETILAALERHRPVEAWPQLVYESSPAPLGMCGAHDRCWLAAAASGHDWVFHLEDDFVLLRPLQVDHLRETLDAEPSLTQLALVRTPWGFEVEHGGYIPQTPGHYERRETRFVAGAHLPLVGFKGGKRDRTYRRALRPDDEGLKPGEVLTGERARWIATQRNWATNPALFRTDLTRRYPWPTDGPCERSIGDAILADRPDAVFGLWGWGEPWAAHIGVERQPGAYGYH